MCFRVEAESSGAAEVAQWAAASHRGTHNRSKKRIQNDRKTLKKRSGQRVGASEPSGHQLERDVDPRPHTENVKKTVRK